MTQVQRWTGVVSASESGGFVAYGDYLALLDRLEKDEKDAQRYRWLRERYTAVNFDWEESGQQAVIFTADDFPIATASCDETIDSAMEASK